MKKIIFFFLLTSITVFSQEIDSKIVSLAELEEFLPKKFRISEDRFSKSLTIIHKDFRPKMKRIKLYIEVVDSLMNMRHQIIYSGSDWLFVHKIKLLIDDEVFEFNFDDPTREVISGGVYEKIHRISNKEFIEILRKIVLSKNKIFMRYIGDKHFREEKFNKFEIEGIRQTLEYYDKF